VYLLVFTHIFTGDFASWTVHFVNICVQNEQMHQLLSAFRKSASAPKFVPAADTMRKWSEFVPLQAMTAGAER
jgi:hypothetical protein